MVTMTLDSIILFGCVVVVEADISNFVVGLTDENPAVTPPVWNQYFSVKYKGKVPQGASGKVTFPESDDLIYRYVIIQSNFPRKRGLCLAEVQVYVRGM